MNKKLILFFLAANITLNIYAQPCFSTAKQVDSLVEQLKRNIPVRQDDNDQLSKYSTKEDSFYNWLYNFPIQLCKKIPLFDKIQDYSFPRRQLEYMVLLNFYRNSNDSILRNYVASKLFQAKYYEFFYSRQDISKIEVSEALLKAMADYTNKTVDTIVLKKILIANRMAKNKNFDTLSEEDYHRDSATYCNRIFNNYYMDYFIMGTASDLKLTQFALWLENKIIKKECDDVISEYKIKQALARMRYKNYYEEMIKQYINPPVYIDADQYAPNVLYIECKECFNEWLKQLSDTTTRIVVKYETSERTYYDTAYLAKYLNECLFTLFRVFPPKDWSPAYIWFFYPCSAGTNITMYDKRDRLPYNKNKLQKFINEGYPFNVSRYYYKYIK